MHLLSLQSDQLYTWSDHKAEQTYCCAAQTTRNSVATTTAAPSGPAWFADRALQALRQARVQMRRGPRPWPQVLPLGKLPRLTSAHGLRAARTVRTHYRIAGQLPSSPRDLRGNLGDQSRTDAPPRGASLTGHHGGGALRTFRICGSVLGRRASGQYARGLVGWPSRRLGNPGGSQ
jgi:hypothetical protein